jgi:hypothetical protein
MPIRPFIKPGDGEFDDHATRVMGEAFASKKVDAASPIVYEAIAARIIAAAHRARSSSPTQCRSDRARLRQRNDLGPPQLAGNSRTPEESQVESGEYRDNSKIHDQPFPESFFEEHDIYADYDGCHRQPIKRHGYLSAHFSNRLSWRPLSFLLSSQISPMRILRR